METKRDTIIKAAAKVFRQYGFSKASFNDVAKAAGKGRTSLYKYFKNKEDLFRESMKYYSSEFFNEINDIAQSKKKASEKIKKYNSVKFKFIEAYQRENMLSAREVACSPNLREMMMEIHGKKEIDAVFKMILDGIKSGDFKLVSQKQAKLTASIFYSTTSAIMYELYEKNDIKNFGTACQIIQKMFISSLLK